MQLKDSQTYKNLARAYAGECMAKARYMFIEYGARKEGFKCLAELVDKVVYNEFNHARMFYSFIQTADKKPIEEIEIKADYPFKEKWDISRICENGAQRGLRRHRGIVRKRSTGRELSQNALHRPLRSDEGRDHVQKARSRQVEVRRLRLRSHVRGSVAGMSPVPGETGRRHAQTLGRAVTPRPGYR